MKEEQETFVEKMLHAIVSRYLKIGWDRIRVTEYNLRSQDLTGPQSYAIIHLIGTLSNMQTSRVEAMLQRIASFAIMRKVSPVYINEYHGREVNVNETLPDMDSMLTL